MADLMKVTAPVKGFSGVKAGVRFVDGKAETDNARSLNYFRRHGYDISAAGLDDAEPVEEAAEPGPFDPAEHDVPAVLAHLEQADEAEAVRVLDAEAAGKARKGILDHRDAIVARARAADKEGAGQ